MKKADVLLKNCRFPDWKKGELIYGDIAIEDGFFCEKREAERTRDMEGKILLPSLIDAHMHIESTMLTPAEFARAVLPHGTGTVVCDPHEIANVCGEKGIEWMLAASAGLPFEVFVMLPSCVPCAEGEESGARLDASSLAPFMASERVLGLAEVMDVDAVLSGDADMLKKLALAKNSGKRIDGHCPGLAGERLKKYIAAGVESDHECVGAEEALEKLRGGMRVMLREGAAAKNLKNLAPCFSNGFAGRVMLATDDIHADLLEKGHIDRMVREAIALGVAPLEALRAASLNAAEYFGLADRGEIAPGKRADFFVTESLPGLRIEEAHTAGKLAWSERAGLVPFDAPKVDESLERAVRGTFHMKKLGKSDFESGFGDRAIELVDREILTREALFSEDCVRAAVIERHRATGHIGKAWLKNYGLREGAVALSVAHDSHNLIVAGMNAEDMAAAANRAAELGGGIAVALGGRVTGELALPIGGLMSERPLAEVTAELERLRGLLHGMGVSEGADPFMSLSFLSLPVIPEIRLTTRGIVRI